MHINIYIYIYIYTYIVTVAKFSASLLVFGRTLEAPIPKMSGLVKKVGPFSKRTNPL